MPPVLIAAGVAAATSIAGAALSSHATSSAVNSANQTQQNIANQNNALQLDLRNRNEANFAPYSATGLQAMSTLNGLLYGQPSGGSAPGAAPGGSGVDALYGSPGGGIHPQGQLLDGATGGMGYEAPTGTAPPQNGVTAPAPNAQDAWDQFRNGSQYQWRLGQGFNALNQGLAGQGALHSGAAQKAAIRYGQGFASNELGNYVNLLQGQQNLGFGGAQALAGVGNNYANNVQQNNNNAADAASNAALLRGQSTNQMYGGIANALGNFASSFGGSKPSAPGGFPPALWGF